MVIKMRMLRLKDSFNILCSSSRCYRQHSERCSHRQNVNQPRFGLSDLCVWQSASKPWQDPLTTADEPCSCRWLDQLYLNLQQTMSIIHNITQYSKNIFEKFCWSYSVDPSILKWGSVYATVDVWRKKPVYKHTSINWNSFYYSRFIVSDINVQIRIHFTHKCLKKPSQI